AGFGSHPGRPHVPPEQCELDQIRFHLATPRADRIEWIRTALLCGMSIEEINDYTHGIDPWFLGQLTDLVAHERELAERGRRGLAAFDAEFMRATKRLGYSDRQIAAACSEHAPVTEWDVREARKRLGVLPVYKLVDTCAAEFEAYTPYYYSTYDGVEDEVRVPQKPAVVVLGGGPNRIGQGIEFDYCCVHAAMALRAAGYAVVMVNSNPETVSTDFDTSDLLFFEPLTHEDVMNVIDAVRAHAVIPQFGGQTPLNLARGLVDHGAPIVGTSVDSIERAEDRDLFAKVVDELKLRQPANGMAKDADAAVRCADALGYPVVVRPSFVLGGRAMKIVYDRTALQEYMAEHNSISAERPVLIDKFLDNAIEVDVDAIADGETVVSGGSMEHIEEAGIHSGDSSCSLPPYTLSDGLIAEITDATVRLARSLEVVGLMNIQFAVRGPSLYVLE